jgi:hypothetical protein
MARHNTVEERELIKMIEGLPFHIDEKQAWIDQLHGTGLTEDLAKEIQQLVSVHEEGEAGFPNRARYLLQLSSIVRRWRLASQKQLRH